MKNNLEYEIGLDIGTNSVGYAVTDTSGNLMKFKGKNMWGVRLFEEGKTAKPTRLLRCTRRRYDRRRNRIGLLQQFLAEDVQKADEHFFLRLQQSFLWPDDRELPDIYTLFSDEKFDDKVYYGKYPTMYHLRKELMTNPEKADIRLIYLALHHIMKYRGNFLYEGQSNVSAENSQIQPAVHDLVNCLSDLYELEGLDSLSENIAAILAAPEKKKSDKAKEIVEVVKPDSEHKPMYSHIAKALIGYKADFSVIFDLGSEENQKFALSEEDADLRLTDLLDDAQAAVYEAMQKVYSAFVLAEILKGDNVRCLSDAMIQKFNKHKHDLALLKRVYRSLLPKAKYVAMFRGKKDPLTKQYQKVKNLNNYTGYILGENCCSQEDLYKTIKKDLEGFESDPNCARIFEDIENADFLPKINAKANGAIPYQLHLEELVKIAENQGRFYPSLTNNLDKLKAIVSFRIPYYVGPLNEKANPDDSRQFAWLSRKTDGEKIYPWNFEEIVDTDESAERFIRRMTNKCTYLPTKDVIPKCSLLYAEYEVLNEIRQIKVDGRFLPLEVKKALFEQVFKRQKTVTETALKNWLMREQKHPQIDKITGFQKEDKFASSLTAYIDFSGIFGIVDAGNKEMIETLILWITLFEDKKILQRKIMNEMPSITAEQRVKICKLRYSGWSRLSRELLEGIRCPDGRGGTKSIIETLRSSSKNFMQIINDETLGFKQAIEELAKPEKLERITSDVVDELAGSPAIKRGIKQSTAVVEELVSVMGKAPARIYIEFAREEGEKARTSSRLKKLQDAYKAMTSSEDCRRILDELKTREKNLDDRMIYLYFLQMGKCLYSGRPLDLASLSQTCQIDHIIPRSYIKDDSFDNLALVLSGMNQDKAANMLLSPEIQRNQRGYWMQIYRCGLISEKKHRNLLKTEFSEDELKGFINRQLVETRQIIKHVANLFGAAYDQTEIVEIKAELTGNLRAQYGLPKVREINDYHHAHDALLAATIGRYVRMCHPYMRTDFDYRAISRFAANRDNVVKTKYGYIIGSFKFAGIDRETGETWDGQAELDKLRRCLNYKDCFISKKVEELTGEFFKQTVQPKAGDTDSKLIPLKKHLPVSRYGGYYEPQQAYMAVVECDGKRGREKRLVGIPLYIVRHEQTQQDAVINYLTENGCANPIILKNRIMKYQKIRYEGNEFYLSSSMEVHNARQLVLSERFNRVVFEMNAKTGSASVNDEDLIALFDELCAKMDKFYPCYATVLNKIRGARQEFAEKQTETKIAILNQLLIMLKANASNGAFAKLNFAGLPDRVGRMCNKNLSVEKIVFVNTSVTGLFESIQEGRDV